MSEAARSARIRRQVFINTLSNYAGRVVALGMGFFLTPFILHQVGAVSFGLWVLIGSVMAYAELLDLGISNAVIKYVAEYRARGEFEELRRVLATALALFTLLGLIVTALSFAFASAFVQWIHLPAESEQTAVQLLMWMGLATGIGFPSAITWTALQGLQRFDLQNLLATSSVIVVNLVAIITLLLGGGIIAMVAWAIPASLAMQLLSLWLIRRVAPEVRLSWRGATRAHVRRILSFGLTLTVMRFAGRLKNRTDDIVIASALPVSAVTPYALARRLSEITTTLTDQFLKVVVPLASQLHAENDAARLRVLYITGTRLTLALFVPIGGTLMILASPFLALWVGTALAPPTHLVSILMLAALVDASQGPAVLILQGMARHRPVALMTIVSGIINLLLSLVLVQPLEVTGVALGTLIPTTIEGVLFIMPYTLRTLGVSARDALAQMLWPALAPALPMALVLFVLREWLAPTSWLTLALVVACGMSAYTLVYLGMDGNRHERQTVRHAAQHALMLARTRIARLRPL